MTIRASGKISRIYPHNWGCSFRLNTSYKIAPKDGYFKLPLDHKNYNSLFSLALAAMLNDIPINIRTQKDLNAGEEAEIAYIFVDIP